MAADRGILSAFENATGIDIPDQIAGVTIPDPDLGAVGDVAENFLNAVGDMGDLVEKAAGMRELVANGRRTAGNCWGVIDQAQEVYSNISRDIEPVSPLLQCGRDFSLIPQAFGLFTKENLDACVRIIADVLSLGKLLQKISSILDGVKKIFEAIMETCGDVIDKVMEFVSDLAQAFAEALHLDQALAGISGLFEGIAGIVGELGDISSILNPICEAWGEANWVSAATFAATHWEEVKDAFSRFWPAWEESQSQYGAARDMGQSAGNAASRAWGTVRPLVTRLCEVFHVEVPGGDDGNDRDAELTVMPRGGFELEAPPEFAGEPLQAGGSDQERPPHLQLYDRAKDTFEGVSYERMRYLLNNFGGLEGGEMDDMIAGADGNGDGLIDEGEFDAWFTGEAICDEDREMLLGASF